MQQKKSLLYGPITRIPHTDYGFTSIDGSFKATYQ